MYWWLLAVMHTSASLALNESWDPNVRDDMEMMLNKIVPEGLPYRHSCEGPDDMVRYPVLIGTIYCSGSKSSKAFVCNISNLSHVHKMLGH